MDRTCERSACKVLIGIPEVNALEYLGVDGRIILKRILRNKIGEYE
jgi:hypothetical protein